MVRAQFSEFSYGFAFTHELVNHFPGLTVAPRFPSLVEEGKAGYDMKMPIRGVPMYFQYKLSDFLKGHSAKYWNQYGNYHYRFHVTPLNISSQHKLLKELADLGEEVYYVAPCFYEVGDFNAAYRDDRIGTSSVCVPVKKLPYPGLDEHLDITYTDRSNILWHIRKTGPSSISREGKVSPAHCCWEDVRERFERGNAELADVNGAYLYELRGNLERILLENELIDAQGLGRRADRRDPRGDDNPREVARDINNLLSTCFGLEMVVPHRT